MPSPELLERWQADHRAMDAARALDLERPFGSTWTEDYTTGSYTLRRLRCFECGGRGVKGWFRRKPCHYCGGTGGLNDILMHWPALHLPTR
jgi:hypothetical protein